MRVALFALMAIGTVSAFDVAPAEARDYPFCARTRYDVDDCSYTTYAQCYTTSLGLGQSCFQNPALGYYDRTRYVEDQAPAPRRRHRHRSQAY